MRSYKPLIRFVLVEPSPPLGRTKPPVFPGGSELIVHCELQRRSVRLSAEFVAAVVVAI